MVKQFSRRNIFGLDAILDSKVSIAQIKKTVDDALNAVNDPSAVVGTGVIADLQNQLQNLQKQTNTNIKSLIDDSVNGGSDKTWSIDKIKQYVASVDDTVVVQNIADRDALKAYDSLIAYVLDTSADTNLGPDFRGKPFAYMYVNGKWEPITPLSKEVDSSVFLKYSDIVNNLNAGGVNKPLSAEMGKYLAQVVIPKASNDAKQTIVTETATIKNNKIALTQNPVGNLVFGAAEISTNNGIVVVDAVVSGVREVTIQGNTGDDYEGKVARVSYLAYINEASNNTANDSGSADGEIVSGSGSASSAATTTSGSGSASSAATTTSGSGSASSAATTTSGSGSASSAATTTSGSGSASSAATTTSGSGSASSNA